MEQNIKNFDRGIEQKMNEHEVAPPFGMWNRISAELEAMPVAAAAPVATSLIPKRAMMGIIASALIIGTALITGYLVSSSTKPSNVSTVAPIGNTQIEATTKPIVNTPVARQTISVKNDIASVSPIVAKPRVHHSVASNNPVQSTIQAAQQVTPTINEPVAPVVANPIVINNANTDVPTPIEPVSQNISEETQTYYFPPIDVATSEKSKPANESPIATKNHNKATTTASSDNDGPSEHKIKFRMHKKKGWAYGNIIR